VSRFARVSEFISQSSPGLRYLSFSLDPFLTPGAVENLMVPVYFLGLASAFEPFDIEVASGCTLYTSSFFALLTDDGLSCGLVSSPSLFFRPFLGRLISYSAEFVFFIFPQSSRTSR